MRKRPPKPHNQVAAPRFERRPEPAPNEAKSLLRKLSLLTKAQPSFEHLADFQKETQLETNHRGGAILIATNVENALESALLHFFKKGRTKSLLDLKAPLADFNNKILIGYALDIYGDKTFSNLEIIRCIRNAFAHAKIPITFETEAVAKVCATLTVPELLPPYATGAEKIDGSKLRGLDRFRFVSDRISHNLVWTNAQGIRALGVEDCPWVDHQQYQIYVRRQPLP